MDTIADTGTKLAMTHEICSDAIDGLYASGDRLMVVCTESQAPSNWSENDRNTLRHEGIHLAQDCEGVRAGNLALAPLVKTEAELNGLIMASGIPASRIADAYYLMGASEHEVWLEMEAWSLAELLTDTQVAEVISRACGLSGV